jgi:hypothetical protein
VIPQPVCDVLWLTIKIAAILVVEAKFILDSASVFFPTVQKLGFCDALDFTFPHKASLSA